MRALLLSLLLIIPLFGQTYDDTVMNIDITIHAPTEVVERIDEVRCYIEVRPQGQVMQVYTGMPLAEAEALGGTLVQSSTYGDPINYQLLANGNQYNVCVFGLDGGNEIVQQVGFTNYHLRSGTSGVGTLPLMQLVEDEDIFIFADLP